MNWNTNCSYNAVCCHILSQLDLRKSDSESFKIYRPPTRCVLTEPLRAIWTLVKTKRTYDRNRRAQSKLEFHRCLNHKTEKPAVSYAVTANGMIFNSLCSSDATEMFIATTCYAATCTAYRGYRTCRVEHTCPTKKKSQTKMVKITGKPTPKRRPLYIGGIVQGISFFKPRYQSLRSGEKKYLTQIGDLWQRR